VDDSGITLKSSRMRGRNLLILPDQGRAQRISPEFFGIRARDRSWNAYLDSFIKANKTFFDALEIDLSFSTSPGEIDISLRANGVIGAVPLLAPDTHKVVGGIIVQPRYGWNSIGSMFSAIGWSALPDILKCPMVPGSAREIPPWVIAGPAVTRLEQLMRSSGPRFRPKTDIRTMPRGQIIWNRYCSEQLPRGDFHKLPCSFSDLDIDENLFRYIRWALERVEYELSPHCMTDLFARRLQDRVVSLISSLGTLRALFPDHRTLDALERDLGRRNKLAHSGIESIRWILDERGLAGKMNTDGLSWRLRMHELFEQWVVTIVTQWSRQIGGRVLTGRSYDSVAPIQWDRSWVSSLTSLVPDVVTQTESDTFIFDAKYKGFLDDIDERRWRDYSVTLRNVNGALKARKYGEVCWLEACAFAERKEGAALAAASSSLFVSAVQPVKS